MAHYISERELRKLERDRRKIEEERDRLEREIEQEQNRHLRNTEDCREELLRLRREREDLKRQNELDRKRYENEKRIQEEMEHRQIDEEKRMLEVERKKHDMEKRRLETERRRLHEEETRRREELKRKEEENIKRHIDENRRIRYEERCILEEQIERQGRVNRKHEEQRRKQEKMKRVFDGDGKDNIEYDDDVFEEREEKYENNRDEIRYKDKTDDKIENKPEEILRRRSETALDQLKKSKSVLQKELAQLHKSWPQESTILEKQESDVESDAELQAKYDYIYHKELETPEVVIKGPDLARDGETRECDESLHKRIHWIEKRYERMRKEEIIDDMREEQLKIEDEGTDDELERLTDGIEQLKLKEMKLREQIKAKQILKREREKQEWIRQDVERLRRAEKRKKLLQLKEEQSRILEDLRKHEDTLKDMESSDVELQCPEGSTYFLTDEELAQREYDKKIRYKSESRNEPQKLIMPKLPRLTEETFEEWKLEVEVMMDSHLYQKDALLHAVRNSLSSANKSIRRVLYTIDMKASTREILDKLDNVYGDRRPGESHLAEFYKARQRSTETVAEWGIRLENIMQKATRKGQVNKEQTDQMLRNRFWKYLFDQYLKLSTRLFFETALSFENLMTKVRMEVNKMYDDSDSSKSTGRKLELDQQREHDQTSQYWVNC